MNIKLTAEQQEAVQKGEAVRLTVPELNSDLVLVPAEQYESLCELLNDEREKAAWAQLARKAANRWAEENPF